MLTLGDNGGLLTKGKHTASKQSYRDIQTRQSVNNSTLQQDRQTEIRPRHT